MMRTTATCALMLLAGPALAQMEKVDLTKLYVTNPAACEALENNGVDAYGTFDFLALSFTDGIQGMEFHCNFYDVTAKENTSDIFVDAICEEPGFKYPDILSIAPWNEGKIQVGSAHDINRALVANLSGEEADPSTEGQAAGISIYSRCDNLSELPRE